MSVPNRTIAPTPSSSQTWVKLRSEVVVSPGFQPVPIG
jgi:hypothetical protein